MKTKVIEATSGPDGNWGRFLLAQYEQGEREHRSLCNPFTTIWKGQPPAASVCWILDLVTGEGATFDLAEPLAAQLERHQVWVCVLYEPFLQWLEGQRRPLDLGALPALVALPGVPVEPIGYRHGDWIGELPEDARRFLASPLVNGALPISLRKLLKKLLPNTRTRG